MVKAVSNSGQIIHISEVNCFDALQIADVVIPSAAYHEVTCHDKPGSNELQNSHIPVIRLNEEEKIFAKRLCGVYEIDAGGTLKQLHFVFPESMSYFLLMTLVQEMLANSMIAKSMVRQA